MKAFFTGLFSVLGISLFAQNIIGYEYFYDDDPGQGNGMFISSFELSDSLSEELTLGGTEDLSFGYHYVGVRSLDETGKWSNYLYRAFKVTDPSDVPVIDNQVYDIVGYEYFYDNDPGQGNGAFISSSSSVTDSLNEELTLSGTDTLSVGYHYVGVRSLDESGKWSNYLFRAFKIDDTTFAPAVDTTVYSIVGYEYFYDIDPGVGEGVFIASTEDKDSLNEELSLSGTDTLSLGRHYVGVRSLDESGKWSNFLFRSFVVQDSVEELQSLNIPVIAYEYVVGDVDPGPGNGTRVDIAPTMELEDRVEVPTGALPVGYHKVTIRVLDSLGRWSMNYTQEFEVCLSPPDQPLSVEGGTVCNGGGDFTMKATGSPTGKYAWYEASSGRKAPIDTTSDSLTLDFTETKAYYVATGGELCNSSREKVWVYVVDSLHDPVLESTLRCGPGTIDFAPEGAPFEGTYRWYISEDSDSVIYRGDVFTTPYLESTNEYFVETVTGGEECASNSRTNVIAGIKSCDSQFVFFPELYDDLFFEIGQPLLAYSVDQNGDSTGLPITYEIVEGAAFATIRNDSLIYSTIGLVKVRASQSGDLSYYPGASVEHEVRILANSETLEATANTPLCEGEPLRFSASNFLDATYEWSGPNGFKAFTRAPYIPVVTESDSGIYKVTARTNLDTFVAIVDVEVYPEPERANLFVELLESCGVKEYRISVESNDSHFDNYVWYLNNSQIASTDTNVFEPFVSGTYHAAAIDQNTCHSFTSPQYLNLTPDSLPEIVFLDDPVRLKVNSVGDYQWYINNFLIADGTTQEIPLYVNGEYKVRVTNIEGCSYYSESVFVFREGLIDLKQTGGIVSLSDYQFNEIVLYPNPASEAINVVFRGSKDINYPYDLVNSFGEAVLSGQLNKANNDVYSTQLDVSFVAPGVYFVRVFEDDVFRSEPIIIR